MALSQNEPLRALRVQGGGGMTAAPSGIAQN
jgi:hypothetical protein